MLADILDGKCFKLVCGAGNEDAAEVEKLVALYSAAGCRFFDLSAKPAIVDAAKRALSGKEAYLCVSVGIKGDPHVNKARIDYEKCVGCGKCSEICPQGAIKYHKVKSIRRLVARNKRVYGSARLAVRQVNASLCPLLAIRCIGCSKCEKVCSKDAISYVPQEVDLKEILPPLIARGIDCIELHAMNDNDNEIAEKWSYINEIFDGMLSVCTARGKLSDEKMILRIKEMTAGRAPYTTIIQADGFPMSGSQDDYKTTLQAVATAELVQNENIPVYIMLSGGTNSKTAELAKLCGINYHGIAVGTFARKIVKKYIEREDFLTNERIFNEALEIAKKLVNSVV